MNHTCSLEVSKVLADAGFNKKTEKFWVEHPQTKVFSPKLEYSDWEWILTSHENPHNRGERYPACSLTELLEELPSSVTVDNNTYYLCMDKNDDDGYFFYYKGYPKEEWKDNVLKMGEFNGNPCDAAARLWMELKKENIL